MEQVAEGKAAIDIWATKALGGLEAVQAFLSCLLTTVPDLVYWSEPWHRPWLNFGNGGWRQAGGKLIFETVLGRLSSSLLEADGVPLLIGADTLESFGHLLEL